MRIFIAAAILALGPAASITSAAAQAWPDKPVTLIVPFPPGGSTDAIARAVAPKLQEKLGGTFVVDNDEQRFKRIVARGFDGVLNDGRGFPASRKDHATELINSLNQTYQAEEVAARRNDRLPLIVHEDGKQFFLDLRPFRAAWRAQKPAEYEHQIVR